MKYSFPYITTLDEVKKVIEHQDGFIIAERDWGWVANYVMSGNETFPEVNTVDDAIRRECRGLIFSPEGKLISRPYHKYFNVGERTETLIENIDLNEPHVILEKLDGSMIRPIPIGNSYRLGTKMGITDVSMQAEVWLADNPYYDSFINHALACNYTPIFEWCSRKQRIVIDYPVDRLVLTAIRKINSGTYLRLNRIQEMAEKYNVEVVKEYTGTVQNMESLMAETRDLQGQEGWIIRFDSGHMLKIKAAEYVTIHKAKDNILRERGVIEMLLDEKGDDIKPFLIDEDRKKIEDFETSFWKGVNNTIMNWKSENAFSHLRHPRYEGLSEIVSAENFAETRKNFALTSSKSMDNNLRSAIFKAWEENPLTYDWRKVVLDVIRKNINTSAKLEKIRHMWGGVKWNMQTEDEIEP